MALMFRKGLPVPACEALCGKSGERKQKQDEWQARRHGGGAFRQLMPLDRRDFGGIRMLTGVAGRRPDPRERPRAYQAP
jgi:hypothetical protein